MGAAADRQVVLRWALLSRLAVWMLGAVSHALIMPYDASASLPLKLRYGAVGGPVEMAAEPLLPLLNTVALRAVGMFANWDSVFFVRIAEAGRYPYEHFHAFFPALPAAIRAVAALSGATLGRALRIALQLPQWQAHVGGAETEAGAEAGGTASSQPLLSPRVANTVAGFILCNACFVASALLLLCLGQRTLARAARLRRRQVGGGYCRPNSGIGGMSSRSPSTTSGTTGRQALLAALLYCCAPANVFFSAVYTEAPFAMCSFGGMLLLARAADEHEGWKDGGGGGPSRSPGVECLRAEKAAAAAAQAAAAVGGSTWYWQLRAGAAACFSCAGLLRSNGVLLTLLLAWASAAQSPPLPPLASVLPRLRLAPGGWSKTMTTTKCGGVEGARDVAQPLHRVAWYWARTLCLGLLAVLPSLSFHAYGWLLFCTGEKVAAAGHGGVSAWVGRAESAAADGGRPWCAEGGLGGLLPPQLSLYGFVQREYWGIGFLAYYELKQLPNFALASPIIVLSVAGLCAMGHGPMDMVGKSHSERC